MVVICEIVQKSNWTHLKLMLDKDKGSAPLRANLEMVQPHKGAGVDYWAG